MTTAMRKGLVIQATWDDEARVWVAESDDVPGLITEADTLELLLEKLRVMIPELIEANDGELPEEVPFDLMTRARTAGRLSRR